MGSLIADVFVTVKPTAERLDLTSRSLQSLVDSITDPESVRLTICLDGRSDGFIPQLSYAEYILQSTGNEGLGPTINRAIAHIKSINDWYSDPRVGDPAKVAPYVVMCQDDLIYTKDWLPILANKFRAHGIRHKLGFASGVEGIEHAKTRMGHPRLEDGVFLQDWVRASQMLSTKEYWESLMPIPRFDPETGRPRAKPDNGMGSGVDWWLIRNHPNSVCMTGRTNLVMPGLVVHAGYDRSTWLKRELPESDSDKEKIRGE